MAWYQVPIRPLDPAIPDDQATQAERYFRDNFAGTGQNSYDRPPSQDASKWQLLKNVQPITTGVLQKRWGYGIWESGITAASSRLFNFQRDSDGLRTILATGPNGVSAYYESGVPYYLNIFNPVSPLGPVRSLTSRSYQYFFDGSPADSLKWDGNTVTTQDPLPLTNWGIQASDVTQTTSGGGTLPTSYGPNYVGTCTGNWGVSSGAFIGPPDGSYADTAVGDGIAQSPPLVGTNFGFSTGTQTVLGIQASVPSFIASETGIVNATLKMFLTKDGVHPYGTAISYSGLSTSLRTYTFGGKTNLWGGTWTLADISSANFGVLLYVTDPGGGTLGTNVANIDVDSCGITVYVNPGTGSATTSGAGVGIKSITAGAVNLTIGRTYYLVPFNSNSGHYGDLSPASNSTGPAVNSEFNLLLAVYNDPQVNFKTILATADGGDPSILYQVAQVPNSQTTYTDNTLESVLDLSQPLLFTDQFGNEYGVSLNDPPPVTSIVLKHQGRLWAAGVGSQNGQNLFFSKSVAELTLPNGFIAGKYEEAWPGDNYFDISEGAETISGLLTDGTTLYIGTQSHIRRLIGTDPTNFQEPQIVHPQVGLINQEVWQIVYTEGSPSGCMWLTPDFRVIASDFNTYTDIGHPVQDILNQINSSASSLAHAIFYGDGELDLFVLALPVASTTYCDTYLIYDLRAQAWSYWTPANGSLGALYNIDAAGIPQWLFLDGVTGGDTIFQFGSQFTTDNTSLITSTATTTWLHLGSPTKRKLLDDLEIAGDPTMTVTVLGASDEQDWNSPATLTANTPLSLSPFGQYKIYLASSVAKHRYYQLSFRSGTATGEWLNSYNLRHIPFNAL